MPSRDDVRKFSARIHALAGGSVVRRKACARALGRYHATEIAELIHHLLTLAREGWEPAHCVLGSLLAALEMESREIPHAHAFRRLASVQDYEAVASLFAEGPPKEEMDADAAARRDARLFSETLGHLKVKARSTQDPDELAKLVHASDASVVKNALLNPRLTESLVVRVAARRPVRPEPLVEIWKSPRWSNQHAVRRALVFNPYLPVEIGAKIVPLLSATDLKELKNDPGVHESLRAQAGLLLETVP